ncbi:unnamed protein product [Ilex paraguariensis]|uniref:Uncharacterized protein n=1 Tax=Ilex paraguariensis TaxID=185542 RepID=A0ABC8SWI9_9AQUA
MDDTSSLSSPRSLPAPKQLKYTEGIANGSVRESATLLDQTQKVILLHAKIPTGQLSIKKLAIIGQRGKLWRWRRSYWWLLQFKWKWQKPWKLSEWIKHSDERIMQSRPCMQAMADDMIGSS